MRVLVDISTNLGTSGQMPGTPWRIEREITRRLLNDTALRTLPIMYDQSGAFYAVEPEFALSLLRGDAPSKHFEEILTAPSTALPPAQASQPQTSTRRPAVHAALSSVRSVSLVAARGVIAAAPPSARPTMTRAARHIDSVASMMVRGARSASAPPVNGAPAHSCVASPPPARQLDDAPTTVVHPGRNDLICLWGTYLDRGLLRELAEAKQAAGFRVASVCYEVHGGPGTFQNSIADVATIRSIDQLDASDLVFCVSAGACRDLQRLADWCGRERPIVRQFLPGSDGCLGAESTSQSPADSIDRLSTTRFALAVGAADPVKNYGLLLDAWRELVLDPDFDLALVIIGRKGESTPDLLSQLEHSAELRNRIHWFANVREAELARLYDWCHVYLSPTLEQTCALPVAEALVHRRAVICSDRPALRELCQGKATLLDPLDLPSWIAAIRSVAGRATYTIDQPTLPTWDAAAAVVRDSLLAAMKTPSAA